MQLLYDFFPAIAFFIVFKLKGIFAATAVLIAASAIQVLYAYWRKRKIEPMYLITFILVLIFGGLTLWLHDAAFLKWKVSLINWLFALAFLLSTLSPKTLIQRLMESNVKLPVPVWQRLNTVWATFFFVLGTLNYLIMTHFSTDAWVDFKVFGIVGLTILFIIGQSVYLYPYLKDQK